MGLFRTADGTNFGAVVYIGLRVFHSRRDLLSEGFIPGPVQRLEELNGSVLLMQRADEILVENNRVVGVRVCSAGRGKNEESHVLKAPLVISNANPLLTYGKLLKPGAVPDKLLKSLKETEASGSAFVVYIGLDCKLSELTGEDAHSYMFLKDDDTDFNDIFRRMQKGEIINSLQLTDYGSMDPGMAPPGKTSLAVIRLDFLSNWEGLSEDEYRVKKIKEADRMIDELEERYPGFREHIEALDAGTPRTMQRYTSNHGGSFNGFAYTPERVGNGKGKAHMVSPIRGLYLTGAWIGAVSGGFIGSIFSGYTAAKIAALRRRRKSAPA